jgi:uncharacterized protein (TIGR03435 family)
MRKLAVVLLVTAVLWAAGAPPAPRQGQLENSSVTFEVASVRRIPGALSSSPLPQCINGTLQIDPGQFRVTNTTLYTLITWAYGIRHSCFIATEFGLITGGPGWVLSDRFDLQARIPAGTPPSTREQFLEGRAPLLQTMLRNLLTERFKVRVLRRPKEMRVHVLTAAAGGLKLAASNEEEPERARLGLELDRNQELLVRINGNKASMEDFAHVIEGVTHTPVRDRTGFRGDFSFDAKFAGIDLVTQSAAERIAQIGGLGQYTPATRPSIFTVLQEQFGLRLEATRDTVESWVIDHAEKVSEN